GPVAAPQALGLRASCLRPSPPPVAPSRGSCRRGRGGEASAGAAPAPSGGPRATRSPPPGAPPGAGRAAAGAPAASGRRPAARGAVPDSVRQSWERVYPYSWLGILADVAPSTDELIYAWHPDGFALHSMRSDRVSRFYVQVPNGTPLEEWPDDRIWEALATRLGHGH